MVVYALDDSDRDDDEFLDPDSPGSPNTPPPGLGGRGGGADRRAVRSQQSREDGSRGEATTPVTPNESDYFDALASPPSSENAVSRLMRNHDDEGDDGERAGGGKGPIGAGGKQPAHEVHSPSADADTQHPFSPERYSASTVITPLRRSAGGGGGAAKIGTETPSPTSLSIESPNSSRSRECHQRIVCSVHVRECVCILCAPNSP